MFKPHALTLAALAVLSSSAFAADSVTVWGRANVSMENQTVNGNTSSSMVDNQSRLGFRFNHDLPKGMSVGANLEAGVNYNNGSVTSANTSSTNTLFNREASVNLAGSFGKVSVGRLLVNTSYFATADYVSNHNHDTGTSADALYDFLAPMRNAIGYTSPNMGGLVLEAQFGNKQGTGLDGSNTQSVVNPLSASANYKIGALALGLGYDKGQNPLYTTVNEVAEQVAVRAFYTMGAFGFGGYAQNTTGRDYGRTAYRLSGMYSLGQNEFHLNYGTAGDRGGVADTGASQYTLGYNHNLDKQTKVYAFYTRVMNQAGAAYNPGRFYDAINAGNAASSVGVGLRYNF